MNINTWLGCGRLTKDADFSITQKGTSMVKFRMAVNDRRSEDTLYLNVLGFGKMAEALKEHLSKGRLVGVQGKIKVDDYQDKEGNPREFCLRDGRRNFSRATGNCEERGLRITSNLFLVAQRQSWAIFFSS